MNIYISENRVLLFILCSSFVYTFLYFPFLGWTLYSLSNILCMAAVAVYVLFNLETVLNLFDYRYINVLACIYSFYVFFSKAYNGEFSLLVLMTFIFRCSILPFIELQRERKHVNFLVKVFLFWYGISIFINDVLMILMPGRFYGDGISRFFFLGNKFSVGYNHIIFMIMFCLLYSKIRHFKQWISLLFLIICTVCYYIDCRTTILGAIVVFLIFMSPDAVFDRLNTRPFIFGAMVICALFVFTTKVVYIPSIKYFITEVLNRDITLTGRQQIFDIIPKIISQRPLLGYGSSSMIISKYTGAYDAQNGFFDMVVCNGFPSAVLYVLLITGMIRRKSSIAAKILIGGIYAYIFMSMAEVTYGSTMIFLCALLMTESSLYCDQNVQILEKESVFSFQLF